ncbi:hypothetical protein OG884_04535 [Streptosporangium sp. NBC_01755]|uniref:hypothetical protein n=1 Tax=unclassified Streptosporangium TaxID=2632669 RepID=UPI002DDAD72D|nr:MULTISPECIES: hypothetical protein [unclassified Streptosporangium]WSA27239.1 hypothetical protein OIE13_04995 [Streptosporangium sp. NBC_01810]WSD01208.1 hypothetical protein OG884_04535 [Streptosporangium sp. NBC_01755]
MFALALLVVSYFVLRAILRMAVRFFHSHVAPRPVEDILTIVAASIATGVSAQGMWRFSGDVLGFDGPLRLLLFAFIEVAVITSAVRARRNMRENFSAGIDGIAVWALTGLTAVLSSMDARSMAEAIFRLAAPLVAAWLWERGMAIERHRISGRARINWRLTPERALVRIGLAEVSDRTASEVDAHRRLTRVALAAKRARALRESGASERKMRVALGKLDRAMDRAVEHTGLAVDSVRQEALLSQIGALYNTSALIDLSPPVPWDPEPEPVRPAVAAGRSVIDDDDDEVQVLDGPPPVVDTAQRAALMRAAREYWDKQIERKFVPRATDIAHETGVSLATAREYRALWKLEPKAHALLEAAFHEHGIIDTGTFPAIETEQVLTVNGSSANGSSAAR